MALSPSPARAPFADITSRGPKPINDIRLFGMDLDDSLLWKNNDGQGHHFKFYSLMRSILAQLKNQGFLFFFNTHGVTLDSEICRRFDFTTPHLELISRLCKDVGVPLQFVQPTDCTEIEEGCLRFKHPKKSFLQLLNRVGIRNPLTYTADDFDEDPYCFAGNVSFSKLDSTLFFLLEKNWGTFKQKLSTDHINHITIFFLDDHEDIIADMATRCGEHRPMSFRFEKEGASYDLRIVFKPIWVSQENLEIPERFSDLSVSRLKKAFNRLTPTEFEKDFLLRLAQLSGLHQDIRRLLSQENPESVLTEAHLNYLRRVVKIAPAPPKRSLPILWQQLPPYPNRPTLPIIKDSADEAKAFATHDSKRRRPTRL